MGRPPFTEAEKLRASKAAKKMWRLRRMGIKTTATKPAATRYRKAQHELVRAVNIIRKYLT